jgi:hypothetical protein
MKKQRIPLTPENCKILIQDHGVTAEELTLEYWQREIISSESAMASIFKTWQRAQQLGSKKDIQIYINRRAWRKMRENVRQKIGLPKPSGCDRRQRQYTKILKKTKIKMDNSNDNNKSIQPKRN